MVEKRLTGLEKKSEYKSTEGIIHHLEIQREGQSCHNCHFTLFKIENNEVPCPICGYGHKPCT